MNPPYTYTIEDGIRNLLLGRVLLKKDMAAGATTIPVGDEFEGMPGCTVPGANLFYNFQTQGVLVQPAASNLPGAIEYQETVDLVEGLPNATHLVASAGTASAYTVARGAYIRLKDMPTASAALKLIEIDILDISTKPKDQLFPGALVVALQSESEDWSSSEDMDHVRMMVRYGRLIEAGLDNRAVLRQDMEQLSFLLRQDHYLGGTATDCDILRPFVMNPTPGRMHTGYVETVSGARLDWGDIHLTAHRLVVIDKTMK